MVKFVIKHWILTSLIIIVAVISCYWYWHDKTFVSNNFRTYTGINKFSIIKENYDNHESYILVFIDKDEREKILRKFNFRDSLNYDGRIQCPFVNDSNSAKYLFYVDTNGFGPYGYKLYGLEKFDNIMFLFEVYGD